MARSSALRRGLRRRHGSRPAVSAPPPPDPELLASAVSHARTALLWLVLVALASLFVIADQLNKTSAIFQFVWGEAFRAVLLQKEHAPGSAVTFIQSSASGRDRYRYFAVINNDHRAQPLPLAEILAHWLAADSPTMPGEGGRRFTIDRVAFDLAVPALRETLQVTIQKRDVKDLYEYGDSAALDFSAFSALHEEPRPGWPAYAQLAFRDRCAGKEDSQLTEFTTERTWARKAELSAGTTPLHHVMRLHDFDFIISLRTRGQGMFPAMVLHTTYSLRYSPNPEMAPLLDPDDLIDAASTVYCEDFVPEMRWLDGKQMVWRSNDRLSAEGPIQDYLTEDRAPTPEALEKLVEQARSGISSIPTVSDALPVSLLLKLAPWIAIFLAIVCSRRLRILEQSHPGGAKEVFFGRPLGPVPELSWLDGRLIRVLERGLRGAIAIAAALAPVFIAIAVVQAVFAILMFGAIMPWPAPRQLLILAGAVAYGIAGDGVALLRLGVAMLCSAHLLGTIWRSARREHAAGWSACESTL